MYFNTLAATLTRQCCCGLNVRVRRMKSDPASSGFAKRLRQALEGDSVNAFAKKCGLSESLVRKYLSGSLPGLDKASLMAQQLNVTVDWLATGRGPMRPDAVIETPEGERIAVEAKASAPMDEELMARLVDGIMAEYKAANVGLPPRDLGRMAARMHADLVDLYDDPDERIIGLKALLRQLGRDLRAAPTGAQSKRRA